MKILAEPVDLLTITDAAGLDPIRVIVRDEAPGVGQIIIQCYDQAWTTWWGGMGNRTVREFFASCDTDYLADNLVRGRPFTGGRAGEKQRNQHHQYVKRIAAAVQAGFREQSA